MGILQVLLFLAGLVVLVTGYRKHDRNLMLAAAGAFISQDGGCRAGDASAASRPDG